MDWLLAVSYRLLAIGTIGAIRVIGSLISSFKSLSSKLQPLISIYISLRGNSSDTLLSRTSTWGISNLHVDIFYFPRGRDSFPPKFHLIPPKNFFFPTWKIKILHVGISKYPRGESLFPDIVPYRYVVDSELL